MRRFIWMIVAAYVMAQLLGFSDTNTVIGMTILVTRV